MEMHNTPLDFDREVIQASFDKPILVDFWAPWCGPCRILGPVLDQLAMENINNWTLVKVDTEASQEIASQYGIRSIPNVKLFHQGVPIAEFAGALPRTAIEKWLSEALPDPARQAWATLLPALPPWPTHPVPEALESFCRQFPDLEVALIKRCSYAVIQQPDNAREAVKGILYGHPLYHEAEHIRNLARFLEQDRTEDQVAAHALSKARTALLQEDLEFAFKFLIESLGADKHFAEDLSRLVLLALFHFRGELDPMVQRYRKWFAMTLN